MRNRRLALIGAAAAVVVVAAVCVAAALGAFRSDADRARDAVTELLESYVVPVPDEDGNEPEDAAWPADDYGDAPTMEVLSTYGVDADEWHRHCFGHFSFEMGEASADGDTATVQVSLTNESLSAAIDATGADFTANVQAQESEDAFAQGGRAALFSHLVELLYARLDAGENIVTTTVDVSCARNEEGTWVPQVSGDRTFFSALYGGSDVIAGLGAAQ